MPIYLDYSARTEAIRTSRCRRRSRATCSEQPAADGTDVKEGDLLYRIDPRDFQAALDQAKAQLERDTANARLSAVQSRPRHRRSPRAATSPRTASTSAPAPCAQAEAALAIDRAAIRTAELNLGYTEIRAPFAGRLGRNQASVGTLVSAAGTALNTLVQLDPIYVTFNPSETDLAVIQKARRAGRRSPSR